MCAMRLFVMVGLPGSGKTTWLNRHGKPALSSDTVREMLTGDVTNQGYNRLVFSQLRSILRARLAAGCEETWIDSTALTRAERRCWIRIAEMHGCAVEAVFLDTGVETCLERNRGRKRQVPEDVLLRMARSMTAPRLEEGFDKVAVIRG